ncbi:hypothetical protein ACSXEL_04440 [Clostridium perfringens]
MSLINKQTGQTAREILEEMNQKEKNNLKKRIYRIDHYYFDDSKASNRECLLIEIDKTVEVILGVHRGHIFLLNSLLKGGELLGKVKSKNEKLARQILENKGIKFEDWLEEKYQDVINENIELIISSLLTAKELGE